jgi:endoglucanase
MISKITKIILFCLLIISSTTSFCQQTGTQNYLSTDGNKLVDKRGQTVYLTGVNWFGFETSNMSPHGIWTRDTKSVLKQIKDLGFNTIRVPYCSKMLNSTTTIKVPGGFGEDGYSGVSPINQTESAITKPIALLDVIIDWCQANDLKVILDNHSKEPGAYLQEGLWYTAGYDEARWISDWVFLANRYKGKSAMVGCDLKNEPLTSTWGNSSPTTDFNKAAERCGNAILNANPELLIFVEGIHKYNGESYWYGGQLKGVKDHPVVLSNPKKLVYSPHEYGPQVFAQPWFSDATFPNNMNKLWNDNFGYINTSNTAPLMVGEFGIGNDQNFFDGKALIWFKKFLGYIKDNKLNWTFWALNPNSGDTGGILDDSWVKVNQWKLDLLKPHLQPMIPNVVGGALGVEENELIAQAIKTTPNPTTSFVKISLPTNAGIKQIFLNDITGKTVLKKEVDKNTTEYNLDISKFSAGLYLINLKSDLNTWTKKIIKE